MKQKWAREPKKRGAKAEQRHIKQRCKPKWSRKPTWESTYVD